jgi:hypothetical protein
MHMNMTVYEYVDAGVYVCMCEYVHVCVYVLVSVPVFAREHVCVHVGMFVACMHTHRRVALVVYIVHTLRVLMLLQLHLCAIFR